MASGEIYRVPQLAFKSLGNTPSGGKEYTVENGSKLILVTFSTHADAVAIVCVYTTSTGAATINELSDKSHSKMSFTSSENNKLVVTNGYTSGMPLYAMCFAGDIN